MAGSFFSRPVSPPKGALHPAEDAAGASGAPRLNGRALNSRLRQRRTIYVPDPTGAVRAKHLGAGPDSTRVKLLPTGDKLVVFGRDEAGRRPSPPWKRVASEDEAQALVAAHRELARSGVRAKPKGDGR